MKIIELENSPIRAEATKPLDFKVAIARVFLFLLFSWLLLTQIPPIVQKVGPCFGPC